MQEYMRNLCLLLHCPLCEHLPLRCPPDWWWCVQSPTGKAAWIGYVGPIPVPKDDTTNTTSLESAGESAGIRTASVSAFLTLGAMSAVVAFAAV